MKTIPIKDLKPFDNACFVSAGTIFCVKVGVVHKNWIESDGIVFEENKRQETKVFLKDNKIVSPGYFSYSFLTFLRCRSFFDRKDDYMKEALFEIEPPSLVTVSSFMHKNDDISFYMSSDIIYRGPLERYSGQDLVKIKHLSKHSIEHMYERIELK